MLRSVRRPVLRGNPSVERPRPLAALPVAPHLAFESALRSVERAPGAVDTATRSLAISRAGFEPPQPFEAPESAEPAEALVDDAFATAVVSALRPTVAAAASPALAAVAPAPAQPTSVETAARAAPVRPGFFGWLTAPRFLHR